MGSSIAGSADDPGVSTPAGRGGFIAGIVAGPKAPAIAARIGASIGSIMGRPLRLGNKVIAIRHADVTDLLARDLDFRIGPVNETRIDAVNGGPFVLGMDRGCRLAREREALYRALAEVDMANIHAHVLAEAEQCLGKASRDVDVVSDYARPIAARTAERLFGVGSGLDPILFMDVVRAVFAHTFLNQANDKAVEARALRASAMMREWLGAEIAKRRATGKFGRDMMGALLHNAWLDDDGVRRALGGMLVGSIDTTASCVAKIIAVIGADKVLASRLTADMEDDGRMAGWCWEIMRRWPHNPIIIRKATVDTTFHSVSIRKGDTMIGWTQAAMMDASVFPRPGQLRADRPTENYMHFGGGLHACAGRTVNAFQIPILIAALIRRGVVSVGPISWAGPFPDHVSVTLKRARS